LSEKETKELKARLALLSSEL